MSNASRIVAAIARMGRPTIAYQHGTAMLCVTCHARAGIVEGSCGDCNAITDEQDCRTDDGTPRACSECGGWIADVDDSYQTCPPASAIMRLSIACGDGDMARYLRNAAWAMRQNWTNEPVLFYALTAWAAPILRGPDAAHYSDMVGAVLGIMRDHMRAWRNRTIRHFRRSSNGVLVDGDGAAWATIDTRGYLDVVDIPCDSCGACLYDSGYASDGITLCDQCAEIDS